MSSWCRGLPREGQEQPRHWKADRGAALITLLQVHAVILPGHCAKVADGNRNLPRIPVQAYGVPEDIDNQAGIKGIGLRGHHVWREFPPRLEQRVGTVGG